MISFYFLFRCPMGQPFILWALWCQESLGGAGVAFLDPPGGDGGGVAWRWSGPVLLVGSPLGLVLRVGSPSRSPKVDKETDAVG